jgi:aspartyl-tRNA(Asn)/glutamyl-tRNA(Gln) amidotransferase subunit A
MTAETSTRLSASELARRIGRGELSPLAVTAAYLERIERLNPRLNAYLTVCRGQALADAARAEQALRRGESLGPLHGVPMGLKDQFETAGVRTTAASLILADYVPTEDATVVARLRQAGAILLGKHNMTEFAMGQGDPYRYGEPHNPWNLERFTGSSSSGSGVAVSAGLCAFALGEDTGGSGRAPAAHCGVVCVRPTWGRVSRHGVIPLSWSMDAVTPMARSVEDVALVLSVIAGFDPRDPQTSRRAAPDFRRALTGDIRGLRVGVVRELLDASVVHAEVIAAIRAAAEKLAGLGAAVEDASFPLMADLPYASEAVVNTQAFFLQQRTMRERPGDLGPTLRRRLAVGAVLPAHLVTKAERMRTLMRQEWRRLFEQFDVLISPTMPAPPHVFEYVGAALTREDAEKRYGRRTDMTIAAAFLGTPAISVPAGFSSEHLPIGLQIMTTHFREDLALRVAHAYEQATPWHLEAPPV